MKLRNNPLVGSTGRLLPRAYINSFSRQQLLLKRMSNLRRLVGVLKCCMCFYVTTLLRILHNTMPAQEAPLEKKMKQTDIKAILVSAGTITANNSNINGHEKTASPSPKELENIASVSKKRENSDKVKDTNRKRIVRENSPRTAGGKLR